MCALFWTINAAKLSCGTCIWTIRTTDRISSGFNQTNDQVSKFETEKKRQLIEIINQMKDAMVNAKNVPVILTDDFNAPSHLD